jgi:hypothetical protein
MPRLSVSPVVRVLFKRPDRFAVRFQLLLE